ncbi:MAG: cupin domain-containing protein [Candidatus Roizmanbacteria bacterium]|nr:MAG: cupin domain-containing protein [Candidatus Roizmanbacteria bacterium]
MSGYVINIEEKTKQNEYFREVLFTASCSQLVVMSLNPKEEIGEEIHTVDQFLRIESGRGKAVLDGEEFDIKDGSAIVVPAGVKHNFINTSDTEKLKLYTIYSPPEHKDKTVHRTKEDAIKDEENHL